VQYAGFNVFNTILGGEAMSTTAHGPVKLWVLILTVVALVVALIGYDLIHKAEQWLTYLMIVIFGIFTITLFFIHYPAGTFDVGTFKAGPFLGQFGVVAGYQRSSTRTGCTGGGVAGDPLLPDRLRRHDPVLRRGHTV
jgi:nucleobase:cation symporter-1, NCS1 family